MKRHLLVTNDFPPKVGGIQNYLWELWRRLPSDQFAVLTTPHPEAEQWDRTQPYKIVSDKNKVLLPHPRLAQRIRDEAAAMEAELVVLDPALPLGHLGPSLGIPYAVVLHGAEITVPGRLPISRHLLGRVLRKSEFVLSAGGYAAKEGELAARTSLTVKEIPPGVDTERFKPLSSVERKYIRDRYGLHSGPLILAVSRLVPRKGFDRLIRAVDLVRADVPDVQLAIGGSGRDHKRLRSISKKLGLPVVFLGRIDDSELPATFGMSDLFVMPCRNRWAGLEQEGFGIVFVEAAASGVPQIAGRSGGAHEAVEDELSGLIIDDPTDEHQLAEMVTSLLRDPSKRRSMASYGRKRSESLFSYDVLAEQLERALS